jgi:hypothetical protein
VYQKLLGDHLLPFLDGLGGGNWIFQQDGAPIHRSKSTIAWLAEHEVEFLEWPALSPDLNPIENLWGILVRIVYENGRRQFDTVQSLKAAIQRAWESIALATLETLIESMPQRVLEVIRGEGVSTRF